LEGSEVAEVGIEVIDVGAQPVPSGAQIERRKLSKRKQTFCEEKAGTLEAARSGCKPGVLADPVIACTVWEPAKRGRRTGSGSFGIGPVLSSVYIATCPQLAKAAVRAADEGANFAE
jgi:hypothetical protein